MVVQVNERSSRNGRFARVVISSIMMGAIYTTYTVVNNSYSQVTERAKISRSGRDIVEMMMRDIRMAGFKYILGTNDLDLQNRSYLEFRKDQCQE